MKALIRLVFFTLLLGYVSAFAQIGKQNKREWILVDGENPVANYYIDAGSVLSKNDLLRVFILVDLKIKLEEGQSSFQELIFRCGPINKRLVRFSYFEYYSGKMLSGNILNGGVVNDESWTDLVGSLIPVANFVCPK